MRTSISETLAEIVNRISYRDFPAILVTAAKSAFEDTIAVAIAGAASECLDTALLALNPSAGPSTLWRRNRTAGPLDAAFVNAATSHVLDYDDCTTSIGGHPSAPLIAPIIALAEEIGASGKQIIEAYVTGYEIMARLGNMVMPEHYTIGWHPTSTLGVFGSAAACSKLLGLSHAQTASALAIVPSVVAGTKVNFGTPMKPLQVGAAARNGLFAAKLAAAGCNAVADSIEADNGFLKLFNEGISHPLDWNSSSQSRWFLLDPGIAIKQHPCCGSTHSAIDAAIDLYQRHGPIKLSDVDQVIVRAHPTRLGHTFKPKPANGIEAKFSIQFVVAVALARGSLRLSDFNDPFDSSLYKPFRAKLEVIPTAFEDEFLSTVEVQAGNKRWIARQSTRLGRGADRPLSMHEREVKFIDCIGRNYPQNRVSDLRHILRYLDRLASIEDLNVHLR